MKSKLVDGKIVDLDRKSLIEVAKPIFYGYIFLAGVRILSGHPSLKIGTLMGMAGLASITFVSAGLAEGVERDWQAFLDLISITSLLLAVLFGSYAAASASLGF